MERWRRLIRDAQKKYPELRACSADFTILPTGLNEMLDALPRKGKLSRTEKKEDFKVARQQHPAVESAINNLEQRGLGRVRTRGADGFSGRVVDSLAESALGCSDRSGGDYDAQLLFPIVPFRLAQLAFHVRNLEIGSAVGVADTCICNFWLAAANGDTTLPLAQNRGFSGGR